MQNNTSTNIWKVLVIVLVLLNIALLSTLWLKHDKHHPGPNQGSPGGEAASDFLTEQLHFSAQQQTDFTKLKHAHRDAIESVREQGKELHHIFFEQLKNNSVDSVKLKSLAHAIADNQTQLELITFTHFEEVRKLCDEKQKQTFDAIIQEVLKRMSGPGNRQGPPPPPRPND